MSVSWSAPTQRTDGSQLAMSELGGYRLFYGTSPGDYEHSVRIDDPYQRSYTIEALDAGQYYIAIRTYDAKGRKSPLSKVQQVTIE